MNNNNNNNTRLTALFQDYPCELVGGVAQW